MKKILSIFILSIVILSLGSTGCLSVKIGSGPDVTKIVNKPVYTIKVTGSDGIGTNAIPFKGNYWVDESVGDVNLKILEGGKLWPISGITPAEYTISGGFVSCYFRKDSKAGTLKVQILEGDKIVTESETTGNNQWVAAGTSDNQFDYWNMAAGGSRTIYTIKVFSDPSPGHWNPPLEDRKTVYSFFRAFLLT
ncbi:MAG: hypothetical protein Q8P44_08570 [Dehalococcoidia bacterium]|nr:hypothetical protein [Dehalococcoidia bacterium]